LVGWITRGKSPGLTPDCFLSAQYSIVKGTPFRFSFEFMLIAYPRALYKPYQACRSGAIFSDHRSETSNLRYSPDQNGAAARLRQRARIESHGDRTWK
jgi:hypothetical protein